MSIKKESYTREMSPRNIEKAFNCMIRNVDIAGLEQFVRLYPQFANEYVDTLLKRLSIVNNLLFITRVDE